MKFHTLKPEGPIFLGDPKEPRKHENQYDVPELILIANFRRVPVFPVCLTLWASLSTIIAMKTFRQANCTGRYTSRMQKDFLSDIKEQA